MADAPREVAIIGVHIGSDAYPNVKYKVEGLLGATAIHAREQRFAPGGTRSFAGGGQRGMLAKLRKAAGFALAHLAALRAIVRVERACALYIPYPAVFLLFLMSLLPRRWRPATVQADAFISLYDTVVNDRALLPARHPLARLLWHIERRAYRHAGLVWVDTGHNAAHMASLFQLPAARFAALSLSINEAVYAPVAYTPAGPSCKVLFIGTFVPLQGVDVIAEAAVLLRERTDIVFRLVGDGQSAERVAAILAAARCPNVHWERGWQSAHSLAADIAAADICLGIFGAGDKTQRVWPFKNYSYMAVGRALISADTPAARALAPEGAPPWRSVPAQRPDLLAAAILELAGDAPERTRLARAAAEVYRERLCNARSVDQLVASLIAGPREH